MEATRVPAPAERPFHVLMAAPAVGLAMTEARPALIGLAALVAVALLACLRAPKLGVIAASLVLAGALAGDWRLEAIEGGASRVGDGDRVEVRAHLLTAPRPGAFGASAEVVVAAGKLSGVRLLVRIPRWSPLPASTQAGAELRLEGRTAPIAADANDFAAHLRRRGIAGELLLERAELTGKHRGGAAGRLDGLRLRAERGVVAGMEPEQAALLLGMVLGQDERISEAVREDFRASGLAHLLSYIR